jgi:lysophospholipase L1-like esterase
MTPLPEIKAGRLRFAALSLCIVAAFAMVGIPANTVATASAQTQSSMKTMYRFEFGEGPAADGYTLVTPGTAYSAEKDYGFDFGSKVTAIGRGITSNKPFYFSVALPEGNYNVTITFGDPNGESTNTVKAESRRLMLEKVQTERGKFETRTFTVNIRTVQIPGGDPVRLKERERGYLHWDDKLTLEFNGARPCLRSLKITKAENAITVYLAGDSTVTDQPHEPWNSWGQMLTCFFKPGVAIANHAESGESLKSSLGARRFEKIWSSIKPGDYLFLQFGHNDMKEKGEGVGPFTSYKASLKQVTAEARKRGAHPVLVTSMHRRRFDDAGKVVETLENYPEAVRQTAKEENVPLIDLHEMSRPFYEALGVEGSKKAFVDNTHHNAYGSYELAKCIVEGIRKANLPLAKCLADGLPPFDPAHPDPVEKFDVPASPDTSKAVPDGS